MCYVVLYCFVFLFFSFFLFHFIRCPCNVFDVIVSPQSVHCYLLTTYYFDVTFIVRCRDDVTKLKYKETNAGSYRMTVSTTCGYKQATELLPWLKGAKRISGDGFALFSGTGSGSFGRLRSFLVVTGLTVIVSECKQTFNFAQKS